MATYLQPDGHTYSWQEYLDLEDQQDIRYEYHDGAIVRMAGGSSRHNEISGNVYTLLRRTARERGCKAFIADVKLFRLDKVRYLYPDIMVTCNPLDIQSNGGMRNPLLVMEVLSDRTREADRSFKLREYLKLPTLRHYLLIEQSHCEVLHFHRTGADTSWQVSIYEEMSEEVRIPELDLRFTIADVYEGIVFGPEVAMAEEPEEVYGEG